MKGTIRIIINAFLMLIISNDLLSQNNFLIPRAAIFQKYFTIESKGYVVLDKLPGKISAQIIYALFIYYLFKFCCL